MKRSTERTLTGLGIGLALGFGAALTLGALADRDTGQPQADINDNTQDLQPSGPLAVSPARRTAVVRAVEKVAPSVVSITTETPNQDMFGRNIRQGGTSNDGSGVVIDAQGVILTNAHVIASASRIIATFADGQSDEATVVGIAPELDLAVLRIPVRPDLVATQPGSSGDLMLGEPVIAIGNPFGLGHTVTTGVISAIDRPLETDSRVYQSFIQTDASINPGSSGGPLLNIDGDLVGINTAIRPDAEGIGFAIPVDRAFKIAKDLIETGTVRVPWLGLTVEDTMIEQAGSRRVAPRVLSVIDNGPAQKTGILRGDIILSVAGRDVQGRADLNAFLAGYAPNIELSLMLLRAGEPMVVGITATTIDEASISRRLEQVAGLMLEEGRDGQARKVFLRSVTRDGTAFGYGLRSGDQIFAADGRRTRSIADVRVAAQRALERHRGHVLLTVRRGPHQGRLLVPI